MHTPTDYDIPNGPAALVLQLYKCSLSVVLRACGVHCRHIPTCSEYAALAWSRFGPWPALWMALARLTRCRPGGSAGADPVPDTLPRTSPFQPWKYGQWRLPE